MVGLRVRVPAHAQRLVVVASVLAAVVASVLAVGVSSASAETGKADAAAQYSACVGPAADDPAGITDVPPGSAYAAAVGCLVRYEIIEAVPTFGPSQPLSRLQLATMLVKASAPAGVELSAVPSTSDFTDIGDLSSSLQDAVKQAVASSLMSGTSATTFDPHATVSRADISVSLAAFLHKARIGPGGRVLDNFTIRESAAADAAEIAIDETFSDIESLPNDVRKAILALAEMGVLQGRGDGTFDPTASVTRAQAAEIITRALAHTVARPPGLTSDAWAKEQRAAVKKKAEEQRAAIKAEAVEQRAVIRAKAQEQRAAVKKEAEGQRAVVRAEAQEQRAAVKKEAQEQRAAVGAEAQEQRAAVKKEAEGQRAVVRAEAQEQRAAVKKKTQEQRAAIEGSGQEAAEQRAAVKKEAVEQRAAIKEKAQEQRAVVRAEAQEQRAAAKQAAREERAAIKQAAREERAAIKQAAKEERAAIKQAAREERAAIKQAAREERAAAKQAAKEQRAAVRAEAQAQRAAIRQAAKEQRAAAKEQKTGPVTQVS